ncbi:MAG: hypothetical protein JRJ84_23190, partial [Deltaproteobacteria bacterium]|nr:hypothetical protein [Deltaproteobacteria bacterium]
MPHPGHRVDLALVPKALDAPPGRASFAHLLAALQSQGVIGDDGRATEAAGWLVPGGFRNTRLDEPGTMTLYANQQGGFRVKCPVCGANAVPDFQIA